jgi:hypothetical protein
VPWGWKPVQSGETVAYDASIWYRKNRRNGTVEIIETWPN